MTTLRLLSWADYISPQTLEQFERQFGVKVQVETVPSAVEMLEQMRNPATLPDLLCPPDYVVTELASEGRLQTLDHAQLPNLAHIQARFRVGRAHDPESQVSVVKDWGTTGFMYRTDLVSEAPRSWEDFWRLAEKYSGHVTVLDSPGEVIGAALKKRGYSYNESSEAALASVRDDLLKLKPHLLAFETGYRPLLTAGEAYLALGWNGDAGALKASGLPIQYIIPSEGSQLWEDDWGITAGTSNLEQSYAFLNFVLSPEIAAQEARYTGYATGNQAAYDLLDGTAKQDPSIYPPADILQKLEQGIPLNPEDNQHRLALWQEIRT
jgi:spermidine/putrescine transport system substrate-binding protein